MTAVVTLISRHYQSFLDALCGAGRKRGRGRKNTGGDTIRKCAGSPCYLRYTAITIYPSVLRVLNVSISRRRRPLPSTKADLYQDESVRR